MAAALACTRPPGTSGCAAPASAAPLRRQPLAQQDLCNPGVDRWSVHSGSLCYEQALDGTWGHRTRLRRTSEHTIRDLMGVDDGGRVQSPSSAVAAAGCFRLSPTRSAATSSAVVGDEHPRPAGPSSCTSPPMRREDEARSDIWRRAASSDRDR